eukprot:1517065-Rhodomonas_salina.1
MVHLRKLLRSLAPSPCRDGCIEAVSHRLHSIITAKLPSHEATAITDEDEAVACRGFEEFEERAMRSQALTSPRLHQRQRRVNHSARRRLSADGQRYDCVARFGGGGGGGVHAVQVCAEPLFVLASVPSMAAPLTVLDR